MIDLDEHILSAARVISDAKARGARVWIIGNGGSMAIAQHFAQDMLKMAEVRAQTVNCPSILTAFSNDHSFDYAFFAPLLVLRDKNDPVIIFSCSGQSRNYIEFISQDVQPIVAVVGTDGGFLKGKAKVCVHVRSIDYQICETAFCLVADLILKKVMEDKIAA